MAEFNPYERGSFPRIQEFEDAYIQKLEHGKREYGQQSFDNPISQSIQELIEEAIDLKGWSYILFVQLRDMQERAKQFEELFAALEGKTK